VDPDYEKVKANPSKSASNSTKTTSGDNPDFKDLRPEAAEQKSLHNLANNSEKSKEQKDVQELANGKDSLKGNAAGAEALRQTAQKLQEIIDSTESLNLDLTSEDFAHFQGLVITMKGYAANNNCLLQTDWSNLPADIQEHSDSLAVFTRAHNLIIIKEGPNSTSAFNTIIHEVSHAHSKDSNDWNRIDEYQEKYGNNDFENDQQRLEYLDTLLSHVKIELDAEIDGNIAQIMRSNQENPDRVIGNNRKIGMWKSRDHMGASSSEALTKWDSGMRSLTEKREGHGFILDGKAYKEAATDYLKTQGPFPLSSKFRLIEDD